MNRKLIVRADNARTHTVEVMLDFYLFGYVQPLLRGYEFADREAFLQTTEDILRGIEK
jgi:hypothetical protein